MELKINIYNELDEVVKEHKRTGYSIKMRTVKNVIETLDTKKIGIALNEEGSNAEAISVVGEFVINAYDTAKELLMDIFTEMTEEEYENTRVDEVVKVIVNIVKYSFNVIALAGGKGKN